MQLVALDERGVDLLLALGHALAHVVDEGTHPVQQAAAGLRRTEPAMPDGVNACAFLVIARTASAPTARPTPSHSKRLMVVILP